MIIKAYLSFIISLCLLAITISPVYSASTLPNEAVFNWVQYKFADIFPQSQTVKSELTHEGVHYDLRSWVGDWGTRYLGITDEGEIIGLGDYTAGELLSFGYIDEWEDEIIADEDAVYNSLHFSASVVVSETPALNDIDLDALSFQPAAFAFIKGVDGLNRVFFWPTLFNREPLLPGMEFVETSEDKYILKRRLENVSLGNARALRVMDEDIEGIKRFVIVDHGLEKVEGYDTWPFGNIWIATDYGNDFEFEKLSDYRGFYHDVDVYDIDGNGYDEIVTVNMGVHGGDFINESLHIYDQYNEGQFEQVDMFEGDEQGNSGSIEFADLNNDGEEELIQSTYKWSDWGEWGAVRVWKLNENNEYAVVNTIAREGIAIETGGASGTFVFDYNNDGLLDILIFVESLTNIDSGAALELYENQGNFNFVRVTDNVFEQSIWNQTTFSARELKIADVNNDGLDDIVFNGWRGDYNDYDWYDTRRGHVDLGALILINRNGRNFVQLTNHPDLTLDTGADVNMLPEALRVMNNDNGVTKFFSFNHYGTPTVYTIEVQ